MSFEDLLKSLQKDYLASLPDKVVTIRTQIESASTSELRESFHKLKGTGRTYGLPEVSELAELVEGICISRPTDAVVASTHAVAILHDIHGAYSAGNAFNLHQDARYAQIRKLLPA
ncbi:MAG: Hpt domain-containing protein [Bdellovibrionales bacterium]|nr:Hpt domain-containing protein [Bdellovibrionales bacterium]